MIQQYDNLKNVKLEIVKRSVVGKGLEGQEGINGCGIGVFFKAVKLFCIIGIIGNGDYMT